MASHAAMIRGAPSSTLAARSLAGRDRRQRASPVSDVKCLSQRASVVVGGCNGTRRILASPRGAAARRIAAVGANSPVAAATAVASSGGDDADVVVIGSGVGGLTAAALLAYYGKKVIVLESHYATGGAAHGFSRKTEHGREVNGDVGQRGGVEGLAIQSLRPPHGLHAYVLHMRLEKQSSSGVPR